MRAFLLLALLLVPLAFSGCSSGDGYKTPPQDDKERYVIRILEGNKFDIPKAKVPVGATVIWINEAGFHDITVYYDEKPGYYQWGSFKDGNYTDLMGPGDTYQHTFNEPREWFYVCHTHHKEMEAHLRVEAVATPETAGPTAAA